MYQQPYYHPSNIQPQYLHQFEAHLGQQYMMQPQQMKATNIFGEVQITN
jgi:hypothetical protein